MHVIPFEIPPPKNESDFERLCAQVYGVVFNDRMPKMNGRRGQAQGGVDVFVKEPGLGRIGIQCKKYTLKPVKLKDVTDEVKKADDNKIAIKKLILATTAPSDAVLLKQVQELSDAREAADLFPVEVEFWDDICNHIDRFPVLQDSYAPQTPGAAYHRSEAALHTLLDVSVETRNTSIETRAALLSIAALPGARDDSADRMITAQLDRTNELLKAGRYRDALDHLYVVGKDMQPFDEHQKARWNLQRGFCLWFSGADDKEAAEHFLKSFELYPDDERMAAAHIRGLMLQGKLDEALEAGRPATERFPASQQVWLATANVRLLKGDPVRMADVPELLKSEPDTLQFVALAELKFEFFDEAIRLSQLAFNHPTSGFFIRAAALRIAVECCSRFPIGAMHGSLPVCELQAVQFAVKQFEPWHEVLWGVQSDSVDETVTHLGYAYLVLHRFSDVLALCREAATHAHRSSELLRIQVTALFELDQDSEILELTNSRLADMNFGALVVVGQMAAKNGDTALLARVGGAAAVLTPPHTESLELLNALRWDALARAGEEELAVSEVLAAQLTSSGSLILLCMAARVLNRAGRALEAEDLVEKAKGQITKDSSQADILMLAELLFNVEHWAAAGVLYEGLLPTGPLSEIHNRLLACHVRSGNRKRAKEFISRLPPGWIESDKTRGLAIELGQQVGDWAFLKPLMIAQVKREPDKVGSWLFKLHVSLRSSTPSEFQGDLRSVPEMLSGPIRATTQLAALELRYGETERGMRRLYRMARTNLDEPEAMSAYFISIVSASGDLPLMGDNLPNVVPGTSVTLQDEFGHSVEVVLDPDTLGELPKRDGYYSHDSPFAKVLLGATPGQEVLLPSLSFGESRKYIVKTVKSAYRRMLHVVQERANAVEGLPHMKSVPVGVTGDGTRDLAYMKAEVLRTSAIAKEIFDHYAKGQLTLGMFAEMQGRTPVEAAIGWPHDGPPLFVGGGSEGERIHGLALLERPDATYVIDSLTIAELVNLGVQDILAHLPTVLVSPVTKALFEQNLSEAEVDKTVATTVEVAGEMAILEHDSNHRKRRIELCQALLEVVEKYCVVQPAYGELDPSGEFPDLAKILQDEEMEVLLLAKAQDATVLTLDGRLRAVLEVAAKVPGIWPQLLVMHCRQKGLLEPSRASMATVRQFLNNRTFVSLGPDDLTWMVLQGGAYLQLGLQRFKKYLSSSETEFQSTAMVTLQFLSRIAALRIHLGAYGELLEHLVEAALRHKQCPRDFLRHVVAFIEEITETANGNVQHYPQLMATRMHRVEMQRQYLAQRIEQARLRALGPPSVRPIAVRALFCSVIPWLVEDKVDQRINDASGVPQLKGEDRSDGGHEPVDTGVPDSKEARQKSSAYLVAAPSEPRRW